MALTLNNLFVLWYERKVKNHQTQLDFQQSILPIRLQEMEAIKTETLDRLSLKKAQLLLPHDLDKTVKSEYAQEVYNEAINKVEQKFYWRNRALNQTILRQKEKSQDWSLEEPKYLQKQKELDEKKKAALANVEEEFQVLRAKAASINPIEIEKKIQAKMTAVEERFVAKAKAMTEKANKNIAHHKALLERYHKILLDINKNKETYALDEKVVLKLEDLSMHFGGLKAVDQLSFEVKEGEIFGLIGPNGAGKTTVFNCITRFYRPTGGKMYFRNNLNEVVKLNDIVVHNIIKEGIVRTFQNVEMIWELNVTENLLVAAHTLYRSTFFGHVLNSRLLRREEIVMRSKVAKILEDLDLSAYAYSYPLGLPYGILKKIELARTLMVNPKLIILDEPAAGLNDAETENLAETIKKIQKEYNATIFLVEHDMGLVMNICDTVCAVSFGKKLAIGTPKEIQSSKAVRDAYLGGE